MEQMIKCGIWGCFFKKWASKIGLRIISSNNIGSMMRFN